MHTAPSVIPLWRVGIDESSGTGLTGVGMPFWGPLWLTSHFTVPRGSLSWGCRRVSWTWACCYQCFRCTKDWEFSYYLVNANSSWHTTCSKSVTVNLSNSICITPFIPAIQYTWQMTDQADNKTVQIRTKQLIWDCTQHNIYRTRGKRGYNILKQ